MMGIEIERKFAVTGDGWRASVFKTYRFQQGYLSSNAKATVRVRIVDGETGFLTLKGAAEGISRAEFEYAIPLVDALELLQMARPNVVEKLRYEVRFSGMVWEVDVFEGRHAGLVIAEVELENEDQAIELPPWVGVEVSSDDRFNNASLSRSETVPGFGPAAT